MSVRFRARALRDIDDIYRYLEARNPQGARNVLRAIRDSIQLISERPRLGIQTDDPAIRVKIVRRYRYKIFYTIPDNQTVEILHIRHSSRAPWP